MENLHYTAFISYRHVSPDEDVAKRLHTLIENYHIPENIKKKMGIKKMGRVFRDQEELPLSTDLGGDIQKALENSDWLIVIASPRYLESKWCNAELDYFISLGKRDHILTVLTDGEPSESFPQQLLYDIVDGERVEVEPLAGDVRADSVQRSLKKLNNEKLRVLAPMLNVNFDELRQRDRIRKTRIFATAGATVIALLTGFLGYAIIKNKQITRERNLAMNNQMQLLIQQSNISTSSGNKLLALQQLLQGQEIRKTVGNENDGDFSAALEYALYTDDFETVLTIDNNNRQFDEMIFSPDDKYLLGITNINSACLIDTHTGKILHTVSRDDVGQLDSVGFTLDNKYFYMVDSWYNMVSLYDIQTGEPYRQFNASEGNMAWNIGDKVFPYDDHQIIIVKRKCLVLWDYATDEQKEILPCGNGTFEEYVQPVIIDLSPDHQDIVIASHGYGIGMKIVSLDGTVKTNLEFDPQRGYREIVYSGNGKHVAAVSGTMYFVWDAKTGKIELSGEKEDDWPEHIVMNNDGTIALIMSSNYLEAISIRTGKTLWSKTAESNIVTEAYLSENGKYVSASGGISGVFDIATGNVIYDGPATRFSHDSRMVIADTYYNRPILLATPELSTVTTVNSFSEKLFTTPRNTNLSQNVTITLKHFCSDIYSQESGRTTSSFTSPDTHYGAYCHYDGFIEVFDFSDLNNRVNICCLAEHCYNCISDLIFNGDLMASCGGYDPRCVIYDLQARQIRYVLAGTEYCHYCEFSPDGTKIIMVCGYYGNKAYVYSTDNGNLLYEFTAPEGHYFRDGGFTNDGERVVAIIDDGSAMVGTLYLTIDEMLEAAANR